MEINKTVLLKIHISRDFSFAEFDVEFNPETGAGLPTNAQLCAIWDTLPTKDTQPIGPNSLRETPASAKHFAQRQEGRTKPHKEPPATANQRRLLERLGEWREGMTKAEATATLDKLGY